MYKTFVTIMLASTALINSARAQATVYDPIATGKVPELANPAWNLEVTPPGGVYGTTQFGLSLVKNVASRVSWTLLQPAPKLDGFIESTVQLHVFQLNVPGGVRVDRGVLVGELTVFDGQEAWTASIYAHDNQILVVDTDDRMIATFPMNTTNKPHVYRLAVSVFQVNPSRKALAYMLYIDQKPRASGAIIGAADNTNALMRKAWFGFPTIHAGGSTLWKKVVTGKLDDLDPAVKSDLQNPAFVNPASPSTPTRSTAQIFR